MTVKRVGILYHPMKDEACTLAEKLEEFIRSRQISVWLCSAWEGEDAKSQVKNTNLILSIGGDGTILRAAQIAIPEPIPITGINLGNLGFMTELSVNETLENLPSLLAGEGWMDERSLLEAELTTTDGGAEIIHNFHALNDVVIARGAVARVIHVEASIDDEPLTTYKSDGVIVATATGSTGYALAAGGPILHPQARESLLLPILPHLSSNYALVLPSTAVIKLRLNPTLPATISVDGHINMPITGDTTVTIRHSSNITRFLRIHTQTSFYSSLGKRLKGK